MTRSLSTRALALLAVALVAGLGLRAVAIEEKYVLTHDESISLLAATCHQGEYDTRMETRARPLGAWVPASAWQRFTTPENGLCPGTIRRDLVAFDIHPPLYFWLLNGWSLVFGTGLTTGAWLNMPLFVGTVLLLFALARRALGRDAPAAAVAFVWALSPAVLPITAEARQYELFSLVSVLFVLLLLRALERPSLARLAPLALVTLAGALTHFQFALVAAGGGAIALWQLVRGAPAGAPRPARSGRRAPLAALGAMALGTLAFPLAHPGFLESFRRQRVQAGDPLVTAEFGERLEVTAKGVANLVLPNSLVPATLAFALVGLGVVAALAIAVRAGARARPAVLLALWLVLTTCGLYVFGVSHGNAMGGKYLAHVWPFLAFLPVVGVGLLPARARRPAAFAGMATLLLTGTIGALTLFTRDRPADAGPLVRGGEPILVDVVRRGELPRLLLEVPPATPVYAADQFYVLHRDRGWARRLAGGGLYLSNRVYYNNPERQAAILAVLRREGEVVRTEDGLWRQADAFEVRRRPGAPTLATR